MRVDNGPTDRQPHSHAAGFGRVESLEKALEMVWINAWPRITHGHENATGLGLLGADQQLPWPCLNRAHGLDRVQDQVQHNLLQLNTVSLDREKPLGEASLD